MTRITRHWRWAVATAAIFVPAVALGTVTIPFVVSATDATFIKLPKGAAGASTPLVTRRAPQTDIVATVYPP